MHKLFSLVLLFCKKKKKTKKNCPITKPEVARGDGIKGLLMRKNGPIFLYYYTRTVTMNVSLRGLTATKTVVMVLVF